jgi:hypothetical protein
VAAAVLAHGAHEGGAEQQLAGAVLAPARSMSAVARPVGGSDSCHRLSPCVRKRSVCITIYR